MGKKAGLGVSNIFYAVVAAALGYYYYYMNINDLILAPWNATYAVCYLNKWACYDALEYWAEFAKNNIFWDIEKKTYFHMEPNKVYDVPEMDAKDGFTFEKLRALTKDFTVPAVVRGLFDGTPAVTNWADPDYFLNRFENDELIILQNGGVYDAELKSATEMTDTRKLGVQNTGKGKCSTGGYGGVQKATIMKLGDAIRGMKNGKAYYLSNVDTIFRKHNDLLNQTMLSERLSPWGYPNYRPSAAQIFMGFGSSDKKKTTGTPIHCAWGANAFCQLAGSKNWQLMPSRYAAFLHPMLSSKFPAAIGLKFPDWLPRYNVTIHAGDLLMNPSWMWHRIENLEGFNIGIATRENHPTWQIRNAAGFTLLHELSGDNQVADDAVDWMKDIPDGQKKRIKFFMSIPLLAFAVGYVKEIFGGVQPHPLIDAWQNTCDEHDPRCAVSFYDRMVYSYDDCMKELENKKD